MGSAPGGEETLQLGQSNGALDKIASRLSLERKVVLHLAHFGWVQTDGDPLMPCEAQGGTTQQRALTEENGRPWSANHNKCHHAEKSLVPSPGLTPCPDTTYADQAQGKCVCI